MPRTWRLDAQAAAERAGMNDGQTPEPDPVDQALGQMHQALGDAVEARLNEGGSDA